MANEPADDGPIDLGQASARLERAISALEGRIKAMRAQSARGEGDLFDQDRSRLADDLDGARARERALEEAAAEASAALGRAADEVRAILNGEG
jgi:predicted  nucleic acid-binding Zn-ribbon protein